MSSLPIAQLVLFIFPEINSVWKIKYNLIYIFPVALPTYLFAFSAFNQVCNINPLRLTALFSLYNYYTILRPKATINNCWKKKSQIRSVSFCQSLCDPEAFLKYLRNSGILISYCCFHKLLLFLCLGHIIYAQELPSPRITYSPSFYSKFQTHLASSHLTFFFEHFRWFLESTNLNLNSTCNQVLLP